jgi:hypothetical protein
VPQQTAAAADVAAVAKAAAYLLLQALHSILQL